MNLPPLSDDDRRKVDQWQNIAREARFKSMVVIVAILDLIAMAVEADLQAAIISGDHTAEDMEKLQAKATEAREASRNSMTGIRLMIERFIANPPEGTKADQIEKAHAVLNGPSEALLSGVPHISNFMPDDFNPPPGG